MQGESLASTRRDSTWKGLVVHEQSSTWMGGTGESHNDGGFLGMGIPVPLEFLTIAAPPTSSADSAGSHGTHHEVKCRGVERVVRGEMERSNLVAGSREAPKCG